jgi:decaprenylphospho-beta-D-erythro-pentofuranosid-2-ulose 2-reductase
MSRGILVVGATSAIAEATSRIFARRGDRIYLLGRRADQLAAMAADLAVRGAAATGCAVLDANDHSRHAAAIQEADAALGGIDVVLIAHGSLPDQAACERDAARALAAIGTNALSVISLLTELANRFEARGCGTIAVIGSVAGDRGRQSNYIYGTAKAAVETFLQGLRNRLHPKGVHVLTIKPGFVDTPMTAGFRKGPLWTTPERVARGIVAAIDARADVAYLPGYWRLIMLCVRAIPERIFKGMSL